MRTTDILERLENLDVCYKSKLAAFFQDYIGYIESLCNKYSNGLAESIEQFVGYEGHLTENGRMTRELCVWLMNSGFVKILSVFDRIEDNQEEKVIGFIEAYSYLLSIVKDDEMSLIDQLFFIPGQFVRDTAGVMQNSMNKMLNKSFKIGNIDIAIEYKFFNIKESFSGIPSFT